jgi:hypothetical protein
MAAPNFHGSYKAADGNRYIYVAQAAPNGDGTYTLSGIVSTNDVVAKTIRFPDQVYRASEHQWETLAHALISKELDASLSTP